MYVRKLVVIVSLVYVIYKLQIRIKRKICKWCDLAYFIKQPYLFIKTSSTSFTWKVFFTVPEKNEAGGNGNLEYYKLT